jgi:hypothetical protein
MRVALILFLSLLVNVSFISAEEENLLFQQQNSRKTLGFLFLGKGSFSLKIIYTLFSAT